jgi:hypothetical protein
MTATSSSIFTLSGTGEAGTSAGLGFLERGLVVSEIVGTGTWRLDGGREEEGAGTEEEGTEEEGTEEEEPEEVEENAGREEVTEEERIEEVGRDEEEVED